MAISLKAILYTGIGLLILFILLSSMILPYFRTTYESGFGTQSCHRDSNGCTSGDTNLQNNYCIGASSTEIACSNCNTTAGYEFFLANCYSLLAWNNNTYCYQCTNFGYKTTSIGLLLLVFVLALVSFAVIFLPKFK